MGWICPGNGLVPIGQQAFNRTHDDKDRACHLVSSGHNNWLQAENRMRNVLVKKQVMLWNIKCISGSTIT